MIVGVSHRTTPVQVRERFSFTADQAGAALRRLLDGGVAHEAVLLSTCNRTELYARLSEQAGDPVAAARILVEQAGLSLEEAEPHLFWFTGDDAARHLFRVVSGLDSLVLGDAQIQGQVKQAYEQAQAVDAPGRLVGPVLSRLFQMALNVGGRVRSETRLGTGAASVASAALEAARATFGTLHGCRALVLGAGEMGETALACLRKEGVSDILIASRTEQRAQALALKCDGGRALRIDRLPEVLPEVDIVLTATSAPHLVLTREMLTRALPDGTLRPLLLLDLAVPRDVDPAVRGLPGVTLFDMDDLQRIMAENLDRRQEEVGAADRIVEDGVVEFWTWYTSREVVPLISSLRSRAERLRQEEADKILRRMPHLAPREREVVEALSRQILNKVLHLPTVRLRQAASSGQGVDVIDAVRYLFELESGDDVPHSADAERTGDVSDSHLPVALEG